MDSFLEAPKASNFCPGSTEPAPGSLCLVRILHISETHGEHRQMAKRFAMPKADLLLHTGDLSNWGTETWPCGWGGCE